MVRKWKLALMGLSGTLLGHLSVSCDWIDCIKDMLADNPT